ncbi:hypothetical protein F4779DRAFT_632328 [Xylariaceae sp. FL0662B]|nr:hypothetical protein F4779DRAFT_632328 [Xylariaceae sp. FL0662B]
MFETVCEPMFPWRLVLNSNGSLTGFPLMAAIFNISQRLQTVNSTSPIDAGIRLLPLLLLHQIFQYLLSPVASATSGLLITKLKIPPLYVLTLGGSLQTIGVGLFSSISLSDLQIPSAQYGYQVIMDLGFGFNLSTILMMVPMVVDEKDMPVTMAAVTQIRVLGGTIRLAACSAILISHIKEQASTFLTSYQVALILMSSSNIVLLPPQDQIQTRMVLAAEFSQQMRIMLYFSITAIVSLLLLIERRPRRVVDITNVALSTSR